MSDPGIPVFDIRVEPEDLEAATAVLESGWLTMGPKTLAFEQAFAERLGCRHVVATANCTAALHLGLRAAGVGPGDEVIVPAITFVATAAAVRHCGATPVFADIVGDGDLGIDATAVEAAITDRTKAVIPVHFAGYPVAIEALRERCEARDLALVEDAAHTPATAVGGRSLGTFGDSGCFSFFSNKVLSVGEGGALVTDSDAIAEQVRSERSHAMTSGTWDRHRGHSETYDVVGVGFNYRIDEVRSAMLLARLGRLAPQLVRRRELVARYRELLAGVTGLSIAYEGFDLEASSGYLMVVLLDDAAGRPALRTRLREEHGVQTTVFPPINLLSAYSAENGASLPKSEAAGAAHVVLPLFPHMSDAQLERVVEALRLSLAG